MRYIINDKNYVTDISFGCPLVVNGAECTEYTGTVPSGYSSLEEWYREEELTLWRWKIIEGNLTLDLTATAPEEGQWGVPDLQSKTVSPKTTKQTVTPDDGFDGLSQVIVNEMSSGTLAKPSIEQPNANGRVYATAKVSTSGYLPYGEEKENYIDLPTQSGTTITPGTEPKTAVEKGRYTLGEVKVEGDTDLVKENIKKGVSIFGVDGALELGLDGATIVVSESKWTDANGEKHNCIVISPEKHEIIAKHSTETPVLIFVSQDVYSFDIGGGGITAACFAGVGNFVSPVWLFGSDDAGEARVYDPKNDTNYWASERNTENELVIYSTASTEQRRFVGDYTVTLFYNKTS